MSHNNSSSNGFVATVAHVLGAIVMMVRGLVHDVVYGMFALGFVKECYECGGPMLRAPAQMRVRVEDVIDHDACPHARGWDHIVVPVHVECARENVRQTRDAADHGHGHGDGEEGAPPRLTRVFVDRTKAERAAREAENPPGGDAS